MLAGREMSRLSGFTSRVTELLDVLEDLNSGFYERVMVSDAPSAAAGGMLGATPRTVAIEVVRRRWMQSLSVSSLVACRVVVVLFLSVPPPFFHSVRIGCRIVRSWGG